MGVNLPAHLVVIKSTMQYVGGSCEEYCKSDLLQMIGRAGRPQVMQNNYEILYYFSYLGVHFLCGCCTILPQGTLPFIDVFKEYHQRAGILRFL